MNTFEIISILVVVTALFSYLNTRFLKLPGTIGVMVIALSFSLGLILAGSLFPALTSIAKNFIGSIDFSNILLNIMLCFLLFAGALHTDAALLLAQYRAVTIFAVVGVLLSSIIMGSILFFTFQLLFSPVNIWYCFLFGALVAPTDTIAVLSILTKSGVPRNIEIKIVGESLFNDGIGVVLFLTLMTIIKTGINNVSFWSIPVLLVQQVLGGVFFGWLLGLTGYQLMRKINRYQTEVLITLAIVMGGYSLARLLNISGPLAMVVAGLYTGNKSINHTISEESKIYVVKFWELIDLLMNGILFALIGFELLTLDFDVNYLLAGLIAIPITLLARYVSLLLPAFVFGKSMGVDNKMLRIMTWGGMRGGLSIAMALSLTAPLPKEQFVFMIYVVVLFSIIVQGLTIGKLVKRLYKNSPVMALESEND